MPHSPITIREAVSAKLANCGEAVANAIVEHLATEEIKRRERLIVGGLDKLNAAEKAVKKIRPDQKSMSPDGAVVSETYSSAKFDELKKARELVERLTKAINMALNDNDYSKLIELDKPADG